MLKINDEVAGVKRPFRLEDLQNVWDALGSVCERSGEAAVVKGFEKRSNNTWGSGVLYYQGALYFYDASEVPASVGGSLYLYRVNDSQREFADGTVRPFYTNYVIRGAASLGADYTTLSATEENVAQWKANFIADGSITTDKLVDNAITARKIADNAIGTPEKLGNAVVTPIKVAQSVVPCVTSKSSSVYTDVVITPSSNGVNLIRQSVFDNALLSLSETEMSSRPNGIHTRRLVLQGFTAAQNVVNINSVIPTNIDPDIAPEQVSVHIQSPDANGTFWLYINVGDTGTGFVSKYGVDSEFVAKGFGIVLNLIKVKPDATHPAMYALANVPFSI